MALSPGTRLGAYEIQEAIGAGGMGEVYRARDTRLGRDVAIKILPVAAAGDQERRARFEREAKAVAALNHPNIVTIHAVEEADGVPFFAMEYVQGRTLAQMIPARGLPLTDVLKIAIPLTDAVGAAHQRGILHRDLKPANVMITAEGRVKVLDFGLAKLKEVAAVRVDGSQATMEATGEERILGTVAYMSPEQAEGRPLDERSDIFSLGVVLYEMATGQRPFKGDTSVSVISAILKDTPSSVTDLRPDLPRDLIRIIKRALSKDPERRYQTAKDLRNDLETLKEDLDSGEIVRTGGRDATVPARHGLSLMTVGLGVVLLFVVAGTLWFAGLVRVGMHGPATRAFDEFTVTPLATEGISILGVAVSPDGRYVAYVSLENGLQALRVRQTDTASSVPVVPAANVLYYNVTFSPDGTRLYYVVYPPGMGVATLYQVPVLGGTPTRVAEDVDRGVSFSPDGARIAFLRAAVGKSASIVIANTDGTAEHVLATRRYPTQFTYVAPAWSGDGRTIAAAVAEAPLKTAIVTVDSTTGAVQPVGQKKWYAILSIAWPRNASRLIVAGTDLSVAEFSQLWDVTLPDGAVRRITKDVAGYSRISVTADAKTLVTVQGEWRGSLWVAPSGTPDSLNRIASVPDTVGSLPIRWTADGRILYTAAVSGNIDVWAVRPDGSEMRQLTTSPDLDGYAVGTRDGRYIVFLSSRSGQGRIWRMDPDGGRQTMVSNGSMDGLPVVAADSRSVYFVRQDLQDSPLYSIPIEGGDPTPLSGTPAERAASRWPGVPFLFTPHELSPDGSLMLGAFYDHETQPNGSRVAVLPVGGQGRVQKLDIRGDALQCAWAPDGRAITCARTTDGVANLWRQPLDGTPATRLTNYTAAGVIAAHAWSSDGKFLALVRGTIERRLVMMRDVAKQ